MYGEKTYTTPIVDAVISTDTFDVHVSVLPKMTLQILM